MIPVCPFGVTSLVSLMSLVSLKGTLVHGEIVSVGAAYRGQSWRTSFHLIKVWFNKLDFCPILKYIYVEFNIIEPGRECHG
jgi:hypothetical protein